MNGLFAACVEDVNLQTERVCRPLNVSRLNLESRIVRVQEHGDQCGRRNQVAQKPEPFPLHHGNEKAAPCRAADADRFLMARGIILRGCASYDLPQCLRLTVGSEEANRAVVEALAAFMAR